MPYIACTNAKTKYVSVKKRHVHRQYILQPRQDLVDCCGQCFDHAMYQFTRHTRTTPGKPEACMLQLEPDVVFEIPRRDTAPATTTSAPATLRAPPAASTLVAVPLLGPKTRHIRDLGCNTQR